MGNEKVKSVIFNPAKIDDLLGGESINKFAENKGLNPDHLGKIRRGERKFSLDSLADFCVKTNTTPNDFFEIIVQKL